MKSLAEIKAELMKANPFGSPQDPYQLASIGVNEAPNMEPKAYVSPVKGQGQYVPPGGVATPGGLPIGGIDTNPQQPGQQLMPQNAMQPQGQPQGMPPRGPQGPQGMPPQGQQGMPPGMAPPSSMSNILQMTQQGRAMNAMQPPQGMPQGQPSMQPQGLAKGGTPKTITGMYNDVSGHPEPSIGMLKQAVDNAISRHTSLPLKERIASGKEAKRRVEQYIGNGTKLLGANLKLKKASGDVEGYEPVTIADGRGVVTTGLSLSPAYQEGKFNTCPNSMSCKKECLGKTSNGNYIYGGGADLEKMLGPRLAHFKKTQAFLRDPEAFAIRLHDEIQSRKMSAARNNNLQSIRLNVLSDIHPKVWESLIKSHPDVMFYDYTKNNTRPVAPNHHLTYSSTGVSQPKEHTGLDEDIHNPNQNWNLVRSHLDNGRNVAMAFSHKNELPEFVHDEETGKRYNVVDGDSHDFRPLDMQDEGSDGVIIGLRKKSVLRSANTAAKDSNGFFVHYDPKFIKAKGKIIRDENGVALKQNRGVTIAKQKLGQMTLNNDGQKE